MKKGRTEDSYTKQQLLELLGREDKAPELDGQENASQTPIAMVPGNVEADFRINDGHGGVIKDWMPVYSEAELEIAKKFINSKAFPADLRNDAMKGIGRSSAMFAVMGLDSEDMMWLLPLAKQKDFKKSETEKILEKVTGKQVDKRFVLLTSETVRSLAWNTMKEDQERMLECIRRDLYEKARIAYMKELVAHNNEKLKGREVSTALDKTTMKVGKQGEAHAMKDKAHDKIPENVVLTNKFVSNEQATAKGMGTMKHTRAPKAPSRGK